MDDELAMLAKERLGERYGLNAEQSHRLRGNTLAEVEDDARQMCGELGIEVPDAGDAPAPRDGRGRFAGGSRMNQLIREASGRR